MNHKKYMVYLGLIVAFAMLLPSQMVQAAERSFVEATTVYAEEDGDDIQISLYIHGNQEIAGGSLDLYYDKTALEVEEEITIGDQLANYMTSTNADQPGKISLEWASANSHKQEGTLLTITAELLKDIQTTDLDLQNVKLYNENYTELEVESLDGEVKSFNGVEKVHEPEVKANKKWTVRFSTAIDPSTGNEDTVIVKDRKGNLQNVDVEVMDGHTLVVSPINSYESGTYTLEISERVRGFNGYQLREPVRHKFSIE